MFRIERIVFYESIVVGGYVRQVRNPTIFKKFALLTMLSVLRTRAVALPVFSSTFRFLPVLPTYTRALSSSTHRAFSNSYISRQYEGRRGGSDIYDSPPRDFRNTRRPPRNPPSPTIWIGNLPFNANPTRVEELFAEFGTVVSVRLGKVFTVLVCNTLNPIMTRLVRLNRNW